MVLKLIENNQAWAAEKLAADPDYFERQAGGQSPRYLWIGCVDSRVPPNVICKLEPGEVLIHRNVANLVHPTDLNCLTALQFAVEVLKVQRIVVCGHYGCGGVKAALNGEGHGVLPYWLRPIQELAHYYRDELDLLPTPDDQVARLCELNVQAQVHRLIETPILQEAAHKRLDLAVHGFIYDLQSGHLKDLGFTWSAA